MYPSERIDDQISQETAKELGLSFDLVDVVNRFQWKSANEATRVCNSVELSDIGVFRVTQSRVERKIQTLLNKKEKFLKQTEDSTISEKSKSTLDKKIHNTVVDIEYLETKRR